MDRSELEQLMAAYRKRQAKSALDHARERAEGLVAHNAALGGLEPEERAKVIETLTQRIMEATCRRREP